MSEKAYQFHENDKAELVLTHEPGFAVFAHSLHPAGALFEKPFSLDKAKQQHAEFRRVMESHGCTVVTVAEILMQNVETDVCERVKLEELAFDSLRYKVEKDSHYLGESDKYLLSEDYKRKVLSAMGNNDLVSVIMNQPTVYLSKADKNTPFVTSKVSFHPLGNTVFTRDQQITTAKGVIMGRFNSPQRSSETEVLKYVLEKLGVRVLGRIPESGRLEGGDFTMMGDYAMCGVGLRSNEKACHFLMQRGFVGSRRFCIVKDVFDADQDRMHLDCICGIVGDDTCVLTTDCYGSDSDHPRIVDEYVYDESEGEYKLRRVSIEFSQFLHEEGMDITVIPSNEQLAYGVNVLNLGESHIISVNESSARRLARSPAFRGTIDCISFRAITSMYGSVHCASQVLRRSRNEKRYEDSYQVLGQRDLARGITQQQVDAIITSPVNVTDIVKKTIAFAGEDPSEIQKKLLIEIRDLFLLLSRSGLVIFVSLFADEFQKEWLIPSTCSIEKRPFLPFEVKSEPEVVHISEGVVEQRERNIECDISEFEAPTLLALTGASSISELILPVH